MADTTVDTLQFNIPKDKPGTEIGIEYGCRYPDGTYQWREFKSSGGGTHSFERLIKGGSANVGTEYAWGELLKMKAKQASVDLEEYAAQHTLVKRTVILVTTEPEEV
jgi:hypothetical protein